MGIILMEEIINYVLEIDIFKNYSPQNLGVLKGDFWGFWVSK